MVHGCLSQYAIGMIVYCSIMFICGCLFVQGYGCFEGFQSFLTYVAGGTTLAVSILGFVSALSNQREFAKIFTWGVYYIIALHGATVIFSLIDWILEDLIDWKKGEPPEYFGDSHSKSIIEDDAYDTYESIHYTPTSRKPRSNLSTPCFIWSLLSATYVGCSLIIALPWARGR